VKGVRQHILNILKERGQATVADLAEALDRPAVSVRHHLDILLEQRVICTNGVQRRRTRGRPRHVYVLTETAKSFFPHSYEGLAHELLREMKHSLPPEQMEAFFRRLATETADTVLPDQPQPLEERLATTARFLSEKGYLARWERVDGGGYLLHVLNCPYEGLPTKHSELCSMDSVLISELLQLTPRRVAHSVAGDFRCTYLIE
jgi:predicted ArsR family transcriptional regulator